MLVYVITKSYTGETVKTVKSTKEVERFVFKQANKLNFGFYRYYNLRGDNYYDCGPVTYIVKTYMEQEESIVNARIARKASKLANKLWLSQFINKDNEKIYVAIEEVAFDLDEDMVRVRFRWGNMQKSGNYELYVPEYVKSARDLALFVLGYIEANDRYED